MTGPSSRFTDDVFVAFVLLFGSKDKGLFVNDIIRTRPITYSEQNTKKCKRFMRDTMKKFSMCPSLNKAKMIAQETRSLGKKLGEK